MLKCFISALVIFTTISLSAVTLSPIRKNITSLSQSKMMFEVVNPTDAPIAVEIKILRVIDVKNHAEVRVKTDDIVAYPVQIVLEPRQHRKIRVNYIAGVIPKKEKLYRILATELGLDFGETEEESSKINAQVKVRFSYEGIITVKRPESKPKFAIKNARIVSGKGYFTVYNTGDASDLLHFSKKQGIDIITETGSYSLERKDILATALGRILPNKETEYQFYLKNKSTITGAKIVNKQ